MRWTYLNGRWMAMFCAWTLLISHSTLAEKDKQYQQIEWIALMPEDDLQALLDPPDSMFSIPEGSAQDSFNSFDSESGSDRKQQRFQAALDSTRVVDAFAGKAIKIPGYIVPLEANANKEITAFFIVPYFGACIHMPPPPPNQMIYAQLKKGVQLENLYEAFWFEGTLEIGTMDHMMGKSAYRIQLDHLVRFDSEEG